MDVTPRPPAVDVSPRPVGAPRQRRRVPAVLMLMVLMAVAGWIIVSALGSATQYFYNADEAVAQRDHLGTKNFRIQGMVVTRPKEFGSGQTRFTVEFNHVKVKIDHTGAQPALFKEGIPVVCEGHWNASGDTFISTQLRVKHSEEYKKQNPDRVSQDSP